MPLPSPSGPNPNLPQGEIALLEQVTWVRQLARNLVRDPHLAEDLAQETLTAALAARIGAQGLGQEDALPNGLQLPEQEGQLERLRIELNRRMNVRVELRVDDSADEVEILDTDGIPLMIQVFHSVSERKAMGRIEIVGGVTDIFTVPEYATTLILYRGGKEVGREALAATPGEVNVVVL